MKNCPPSVLSPLSSVPVYFWHTYTFAQAAGSQCTSPTSIVSFFDPHSISSVATSPPVMARYRPRRKLAVIGWSLSVPVLMLKVPAVELNVESHDAARRHACDQSPGNMETESGLNQFRICLYSLSLRGESVHLSLTSGHVTGPWLGCRRHSRGRRTAVWIHRPARPPPPRYLLQSLDSAHHCSGGWPDKREGNTAQEIQSTVFSTIVTSNLLYHSKVWGQWWSFLMNESNTFIHQEHIK